jgi:DNA-binding response OmpR family regulator
MEQRKTSILIVEDDADLRLELSDYLSSRGYAVHGVGTLADADQLLHQGFALFLLDINLPDGSGMDFCLRVRPYVRAGIVMLTGRSGREWRIQGLKGGADAYLVKPVDPEELDATLQSVLRRATDNRFSIATAPRMPVQWRVDRRRLTLAGPNTRVCQLSKGEALLLASLVLAEGQQTSRKELLAAFDAQGVPSSGHRVEALISRLRGKVLEEIGLQLPIQSVYGQGYVFLDHAQVI